MEEAHTCHGAHPPSLNTEDPAHLPYPEMNTSSYLRHLAQHVGGLAHVRDPAVQEDQVTAVGPTPDQAVHQARASLHDKG